MSQSPAQIFIINVWLCLIYLHTCKPSIHHPPKGSRCDILGGWLVWNAINEMNMYVFSYMKQPQYSDALFSFSIIHICIKNFHCFAVMLRQSGHLLQAAFYSDITAAIRKRWNLVWHNSDHSNHNELCLISTCLGILVWASSREVLPCAF